MEKEVKENGLFIVFEGLDGSGKTTQVQVINQLLLQAGYSPYLRKEPTYNTIGARIREVSRIANYDQRGMALLYAADRAEHVFEPFFGLIAKRQLGHLVILDRYYLTSCAYQSHTGTPMESIFCMNHETVQAMQPDLTIFIDTSPVECFSRIEKRDCSSNLSEVGMVRIRNNYLQAIGIAEKKGLEKQVAVINGDQDIDSVTSDIMVEITSLLSMKSQFIYEEFELDAMYKKEEK